MKKLKEQEALFIKSIITDDDAIIEMDNKRYYLSLIEEPESVADEEIECEKIKDEIKKTKLSILKGKRQTIDDIVDMIDQGVL